MFDTVSALRYMHARLPVVVHSDLKSSNVIGEELAKCPSDTDATYDSWRSSRRPRRRCFPPTRPRGTRDSSLEPLAGSSPLWALCSGALGRLAMRRHSFGARGRREPRGAKG